MHYKTILAASLTTLALAACGSSGDYEVKEKIDVAEPGQASDGGSSSGGGDILAAGEAAFAVCSGCHSADNGSPSQAGPNLYGVFGRKAGSLDDFSYSEAMTGSGITWDEASLDAYLADPAGNVEGTQMVAGAIPDADTRKAVIAYLKSLSE
ncbi:MAG: c-type cytochrome [Erythrobacter sp.]